MQIQFRNLLTTIEKEIIEIFKKNKSHHAVIIVLFRGEKLPKYCSPMLRDPKPKTNIILNNNFSEIYFSAMKDNSSIKDGAVLIQLKHNNAVLRGFSYRLFPPPLKKSRLKNKGSGYNSAFDFSAVKRVICVYFVNKDGVKKFIKGKEEVLFKPRANRF
ncbi:MAG: hypothetical protein NC925_03230 [Candidatus Omnitrophica bacterium]|nr:hypothetical protein [Candidatus Omnitrophota bacterium]